jgi:hypothetical protein
MIDSDNRVASEATVSYVLRPIGRRVWGTLLRWHALHEKAFMTDRFLCAADAKRVLKTLQKLSQHDISGWAIAGGLAVEIHCLLGGLSLSTRPLNDIDFVAATFDCTPETLARDFLFRHVHPLDPPGKIVLQLVDVEAALRIDLFRANGAILTRTRQLRLPFGPVQLISGEDVLARAARLLLDLRRDVPVAAKHASDYLRLEQLMLTADSEAAWQDHRKLDHPVMFSEANALVRGLIATHRNLLITPDYSKDATKICSRCVPTTAFPLADPHLLLSLLGYC